MIEILSLLVKTVAFRPYVFILLGLYLAIGSRQLGWGRILLFTVLGYLIAFASEFSSTRWGIPYGYYFYIDVTRDKELWITNVPFMDSLSYTFLSYLSYIFARVVVEPAKWTGWDIHLMGRQKNSPRGARLLQDLKVLLLGAFFFMMADVVIDPISLQGNRYFLGQIYGYPEPGIHFGVPLSNYLGWFVVGVAIIGAWMMVEGMLNRFVGWLAALTVLGPSGQMASKLSYSKNRRAEHASHNNYIPLGLYAVLLYFSIVLFNLGITVWIGEYFMALCGFATVIVPLGLIFTIRLRNLIRWA